MLENQIENKKINKKKEKKLESTELTRQNPQFRSRD